MGAKKILMLVGDFVEDYEVMVPFQALQMVGQMDDEGFGNCSNHGECEAVCPKEISIENIARMRREFVKAAFKG